MILVKQWSEMLREVELPVLARTVAALETLRGMEDGAEPQDVARVVLDDPMMTVKVLQYLQLRRPGRRRADITTIAHALMMLGMSPLLAHFMEQNSIESRLAGQTAALDGVLQVMHRARRAALYAHDWACLRHDTDPEEIMVATLLHDLAEMMLWCFAPALALDIAERQRSDRALRSEDAQLAVLGFRLLDLQLELVRVWHLPELLHVLLDETRMQNARVLNVALAAAVARHSAHGWDDAALPDDYAQVASLLALSSDDVAQRVARLATQASPTRDWARPGEA